MRVGIVGAGAIAHGVFGLLKRQGCEVHMWSPSGRARPENVIYEGVLNTAERVEFVSSARALAEASDIIFFALPAYGQKASMDALAPYIRSEHECIISAHLSFSAIYLNEILQQQGATPRIAAWNTTCLTAKKLGQDRYNVSTIRKSVSVFELRSNDSGPAGPKWAALFPNEFRVADSLLDITLANLNPQVHMGIALCNMTRMEQAEKWCQRKNLTPLVGRMIEALDQERLVVADAYNISLQSMMDTYKGLGHAGETVSEVNQVLHLQRQVWGPTTAQSRYVLEDVPYGLAVMSRLGELAGVPTPVHSAGTMLFSALYGRDFEGDNEFLAAIDLKRRVLEDIQ